MASIPPSSHLWEHEYARSADSQYAITINWTELYYHDEDTKRLYYRNNSMILSKPKEVSIVSDKTGKVAKFIYNHTDMNRDIAIYTFIQTENYIKELTGYSLHINSI